MRLLRRPPHVFGDPECMPATKPIAEKLAWALEEIERMHADGRRMDWLDALSNEALLEFGFEMDGGVYLCIESPGSVPVDIRAMNTARGAIDFAMTIRPMA